jgi:hypothetical protein
VKRYRDDKALEVWVGGGRELAGWLTDGMFRNVPMSMKDVLITRSLTDDLEETRGFELTPVQQTLKRVDLERKPLSWFMQQVPAYAIPTVLKTSDETRYAWRVLRLDQNDYDWLFDHPYFEPVDTDEDADFRDTEEGMTAYLRGDIEDALAYSLLNGSAAAYAASGAHAVTSASIGSANDSVMTLEKLTKSIRLAMGK